MLFNTLQYLLFLPVVVFIYYLIPRNIRYIWLLIASYYFYMQWNPIYILLLFVCTFLTYISGRIIEKLKNQKKRNACFLICILLNLCVLGYFKYFEFGIQCLNYLFSYISITEIHWSKNILLPVGISFYILQALGYLIDVYRGDIKAEKNFLKYALFVSFFPQLVAGPIERSKNLLAQLNTPPRFQYENLQKGSLLILYGLFLKIVIADRAAILINTVYGNSATYSGFYIIVATVFFALQIYCDFYGYSTIARGSALIMGFHLMDNFNAPYYAKSTKEFWRRWHISLSGWFRDYLYIPLGGNKKGLFRKSCNLLIVFAVSGLWHGASLSFLFWGILNGIYQITSDITQQIRDVTEQKPKSRISPNHHTNTFSKKLLGALATFLLITFAWLFFRAGGIENSLALIKNMFCCNNWMILFDGSLYNLGVPRNHMRILLISILALFIVDYQKYHNKDVMQAFLNQNWYFRIIIIMLLIFTILLYGCYGELYDTQQFIYFQF